MKFRVIDNKTGKEADAYEIALHEEWAKGLVYCDMEGFMLTENGDLMLADECGHYVYCDPERFKVVFEDERPHGEWIYHAEWEVDGECPFECSKCGIGSDVDYDFCPKCGADMRKEGEAEYCNNTDGCIFCEYHCFCEKVVSAIECLQAKFPKDYERIYGIIEESKGGDDDEKIAEAFKRLQCDHEWVIHDDCEKFIARCKKCGAVTDSRLI